MKYGKVVFEEGAVECIQELLLNQNAQLDAKLHALITLDNLSQDGNHILSFAFGNDTCLDDQRRYIISKSELMKTIFEMANGSVRSNKIHFS